MKVAAIFFILLLTIWGINDMIDTYINQKKNVESLIKEDNIANKVKIPNGLEREYQAILAGESPFSTPVFTDKSASAETSLLVIDKKNSTLINLSEDLKKQHQTIKSKIKNYFIKDDNLFVDLLLYNNDKSNISGKVNIKCSLFDINNKESDIFYWSTDISVKSKEAILLKEINFGYAIQKENKNIWCYVEKLI